MGELLAWIIGWDLVLEYAVGAATVSVSWSSYVVKLLHMLGIELPQNLTNCPWDMTPGLINLPAVFVIFAISILLMIGISESARVNAIIVVLKVTIVIIVIAIGFSYIHPENYTPFIQTASMPYPRRRRRPSGRSAICRSESSARCWFARFCMCCSRMF